MQALSTPLDEARRRGQMSNVDGRAGKLPADDPDRHRRLKHRRELLGLESERAKPANVPRAWDSGDPFDPYTLLALSHNMIASLHIRLFAPSPLRTFDAFGIKAQSLGSERKCASIGFAARKAVINPFA